MAMEPLVAGGYPPAGRLGPPWRRRSPPAWLGRAEAEPLAVQPTAQTPRAAQVNRVAGVAQLQGHVDGEPSCDNARALSTNGWR
jgi:hypothetical protein